MLAGIHVDGAGVFSWDPTVVVKQLQPWRLSPPQVQSSPLHQKEVSTLMRAILVDWLVEVAREFQLTTDTVFVAVGLLDEALAVMPVCKREFQLFGEACLFIASKIMDVATFAVRDLVNISDGMFLPQEALAMERAVLQHVDFRISVVTPLHYLRTYAALVQASVECRTLAEGLCELFLLNPSYSIYPPSCIAFTTLVLSLRHVSVGAT